MQPASSRPVNIPPVNVSQEHVPVHATAHGIPKRTPPPPFFLLIFLGMLVTMIAIAVIVLLVFGALYQLASQYEERPAQTKRFGDADVAENRNSDHRESLLAQFQWQQNASTRFKTSERPAPDLSAYVRYAQQKVSFHKQKRWRQAAYWGLILAALQKEGSGTCMEDSSPYLDLQTLKKYDDPTGLKLIELLVFKARNAGLGIVSSIYFEPLLLDPDLPVLTQEFPHAIDVPIPTLSTLGVYTVRSFLGAIHAVLCHALPPNQTLRQYLQIFELFTLLLSRALQSELAAQITHHTKISLLVCLSTDRSNKSRAVIGFTATAPRMAKQEIIEDRHERLPVLRDIKPNPGDWKLGNCAEDETFAHLEKIKELVTGRDDGLHEVVVVTLTVDLARQSLTHGPCPQCCQLITKLRSPRCQIMILAPAKTDGGVVEGRP